MVTFSDPYVRRIQTSGGYLDAQEMLPSVAAADCVVIVTDHSAVDYTSVVERSKLIVDTRNALKGFRSPKIVRL
jgi:UDP-N-acetyl-D-glucosamine dehydrogenase